MKIGKKRDLRTVPVYTDEVRKSILLLLLPALTLFSCTGAESDTPRAHGGILNLSNEDLADSRVRVIRGEWEFWPGQLLEPDDFLLDAGPEGGGLLNVPGFWNGYQKDDGTVMGGTGCGTYRLTIRLKDPGEPLAIRTGSIHTAHRLFINGREISSSGETSCHREKGRPMILTKTAVWEGGGDRLEIILQVSNFHHREGGIWGRIRLGTLTAVQKDAARDRDRDFLMIGALMIMGLFHIGMFSARNRDRTYLVFGTFCLVIATSISLQDGAGYLLGAFPTLSWEILFKAESLAVFLSPPLLIYFIQAFVNRRLLKFILQVTTVVSGLCILITLVTPALIHTWLIPFFHGIILFEGIIILVLMIQAALKKDLFAKVLLGGMVLLFAAAVNDILYAENIIRSVFLVPGGLLLFIFVQAFLLTLKYRDVFQSVERQQRQLVKTNQEFQQEITMRSEAEAHLQQVNENLLLARSAIILGLAKIAEYRDTDTGIHLKRIQEYNRLLAERLSETPAYHDYITPEYINDLYESSILHDIGKVGIPDSILLKPGKLTPEEFDIIKQHPQIGGDAIHSIEKNIKAQTFLTLGREIAYMHHEKWDGTGYPRGLSGTRISLSARITALSDVYDALTTKRCYKEAFSHEKAIEIILSERGKQFDPDIVDAFMAVEKEFSELGLILQD